MVIANYHSDNMGRYQTDKTDQTNITVTEYEQFIKEYHPEIKDDVYYFTAGELE